MDITTISGLGLLVAIAFLSGMSFKGFHPMLVGVVSVVILCLINRIDVLDGVFNTYMGGVSNYFMNYFLVFAVGAILGKIYLETGAAESIAIAISKKFGVQRTLLAVFIIGMLLCLGGINSLVVAFAAYPIALQLFRQANLPNKFIPAIMCGGMWTFAMSMPFAPQIHNLIPMKYFGTTSGAALIPGLACALAQAIMVNIYVSRRVKGAVSKGAEFRWPSNQPMPKEGEHTTEHLPSPLIATIPMILVVVLFNVISWRLEVAMVVAIISAIILFWPQLGSFKKTMSALTIGTQQAVAANIATAAIVGFGTVTRMTPFYTFVAESLEKSTMHPYLLSLIAINVCAALLGSASGGIGLMLESIGPNLLNYVKQGWSAEAMHRLISMGSTGLDTMPWNGTIVTVLNITDLTYKEGYPDLFVTCAVIPIISCFFVLLPLCMLMYPQVII